MIIPVVNSEFHAYIAEKYGRIRQPRLRFPILFFLYHLSDPVLRQRVFKNTDFFIENISHYLTRHLHLNFVLQLFLRVSPLSGTPSAMNMMIKNRFFIDMNHPALARVSQSKTKDFSRALFPQTKTGYNHRLSDFRELSYFSKFFFPPPLIKKVKDWHNGILFHNSPGIMNISPHIPLYHSVPSSIEKQSRHDRYRYAEFIKDSEVLNRFITKNQGLLKEINIPEKSAHQTRTAPPRSRLTADNYEAGSMQPPPPHNLTRTTAFYKTLFHTGAIDHISIFQDSAGKEIKPEAKSHSLTLALNTTPGKPEHEKREIDFHYLNPLQRTGRSSQSSVKETANSRKHFRDSNGKTASIEQPARQNLHDTHTISQSPIDIARLTDQVYRMLERKIKVERERRGW